MHNIILIITDTFRYDNLGDRAKVMPVRTPELDEFAEKQATSVEGFYTGSFPTIPHRTDIATGKLGWTHYGWQPIDLSGRNHIARLLNSKGYATQLICDCPHLFPARFNSSFQAAFQSRGQESDRALLHLNDPINVVMPHEKTRMNPLFMGHPLADEHRWHNRYYQFETETFPAKTGSLVIRWLEENYKSGPFFLWTDFFDPHEPWDPPEYLVKRYNPDYDGTPMIHPNYGRSDVYTAAELRNLMAHYSAEAEIVDRWIGRVLQKIDDLSLWDNTVVIVTSDHGMSIGEHGRTGKSNISDGDDRYWPLYPEIGHVPFLVSARNPLGAITESGENFEVVIKLPIRFSETLEELMYSNEAEAQAIINLLNTMDPKNRAGCVIITPFISQVSKIKSLLYNSNHSDIPVLLPYQAGRKSYDISIVSFVCSGNERILRYPLTCPEVLYTILTSSKRQLILVGSRDTLRQSRILNEIIDAPETVKLVNPSVTESQ